MKKHLTFLAISTLLLSAIGCSGGETSSTDTSPKGSKPETVNAPAGAQTPEERGMAATGNKGDQDGGGGDKK